MSSVKGAVTISKCWNFCHLVFWIHTHGKTVNIALRRNRGLVYGALQRFLREWCTKPSNPEMGPRLGVSGVSWPELSMQQPERPKKSGISYFAIRKSSDCTEPDVVSVPNRTTGLRQFKIPLANLIKIKFKKFATWSAWSGIDHNMSYLTPHPGPLHPASSPSPLLDIS